MPGGGVRGSGGFGCSSAVCVFFGAGVARLCAAAGVAAGVGVVSAACCVEGGTNSGGVYCAVGCGVGCAAESCAEVPRMYA